MVMVFQKIIRKPESWCMEIMKILIIDDEREFGEMISLYLAEKLGCETVVESDPENALNAARWFMPDLILLDIIMPKKTGFDVLSDLKNDKKTSLIPVIILTVVDGTGSKIKASEYYAEAYLVKPVRLPALI